MMADRTLVEGLKPGSLTEETVSDEAREFVHGKSPKPTKSKSSGGHEILPGMVGRKALTIKLKPDVASDLKRVSIMSQLTDERLTMQDIAEEAKGKTAAKAEETSSSEDLAEEALVAASEEAASESGAKKTKETEIRGVSAPASTTLTDGVYDEIRRLRSKVAEK